ncbi:MAG: alpha/beta hydrolase [Pseudomonadota bacterium]
MKQFAVAVIWCVIAFPVAAQTLDPFRLASLEASGGVEELERAILEVEAAATPDIRLLFDLAMIRIQRLEERGDLLAAARALTDLALFAGRNRSILEEDPLALFIAARAKFDALDRPEAAAEVSARIIQELKERAAPKDEIVSALRDQADREGQAQRSEAAAALRAEAQTLADQDDSETRSLSEDGGYRLVEVFYATDRAATGSTRPSEFYGAARGELEKGIAQVSIPNNHRPGAIELPSIWRLEFGPTPAKHVVLRSVEPLDSEDFFGRLNAGVTDSTRKELFVFIHGYNVTFAQAAKRAAQMAYDMNFTGVPVLYSWPSRGSMTGYIADTAVVRLSGRRLMGFLEELSEETGNATIHIVAHSMGNRALTDALELMGTKEAPTPRFDQVIFAAPDVDAGLFLEMLPSIRPLARRLTLYASDEDWALAASRRLHGDVPRAGQAGEAMISTDGLDAIDMSGLGEDMLAHSYFAQDSSALVDLSTLFWRSVNPDRRCGMRAETSAAWRFVGGVCRDTRVLAVLTALREANVETLAEARTIVFGLVDEPALANEILATVRNIIRD